MRTSYLQQLDNLNVKIMEMSAMVENAIEKSLVSLENQDEKLAKAVIENDSFINGKEREIEELCMRLMLRQQPVASDFRRITSALKVITDLERVGDHAVNIAEISLELMCRFEAIGLEQLSDMARDVKTLLGESTEAYCKKNLDMAQEIIDREEKIDRQYDKIKKNLVAMVEKEQKPLEQVMDYLMIARFLERVGDHAANIAEWAEFSVTGQHESI